MVAIIITVIASVLLFIVIADYMFRNKRFQMLYYKNDTHFSCVVAIRSEHPNLNLLLENAQKLKHQVVFVNINHTVNPQDYPNLTFIPMAVEYDSTDLRHITKILSLAYKTGYDYLKGDHLLFADSSFDLWNAKILDFMANNLIEHQILTLKLRVERDSFKEGYHLLIDFFNDLNITSEMVNYAFFAVKRDTYEMCQCQTKIYQITPEFEEDLFRKNISILHVNHEGGIYKDDINRNYKSELKRFIAQIIHIERIPGFQRMLAFMLAFHLFYVLFILYFNFYFLLAYLLIHIMFAYALKQAMRHSPLTFILLPFWLIWFDFVLFYAVFRRFSMSRTLSKRAKGHLESSILVEELRTKRYISRLLKRFKYKNKKSHDYFEGWYVRLTDNALNINMAFIFALTKSKQDPHAFIQVADGVKNENTYIRFPLDNFSYEKGVVRIGENSLSPNQIIINLENFKLDAIISNITPLKKKSAMGFLVNLPLECFQEVIYMKATIRGSIKYHNHDMMFDGTSYMEKTYGSKFPYEWFWLQSNHFQTPISLSVSGGNVPILNRRKFGFYAVLHLDHKEYIFSTYHFSKCSYIVDNNRIAFSLSNRRYMLILETEFINPIKLVGPTKGGQMKLDVFESLTSKIKLLLLKKGEIIHEDESELAGFEWMYKIQGGSK